MQPGDHTLVALWRDGEQVGYRRERGGMLVYSPDLYAWSGRPIASDLETPWTGTHDLDARPIFVSDPVFWNGQRWTVESHDNAALILRRREERTTLPKRNKLPLRLIESRR